MALKRQNTKTPKTQKTKTQKTKTQKNTKNKNTKKGSHSVKTGTFTFFQISSQSQQNGSQNSKTQKKAFSL